MSSLISTSRHWAIWINASKGGWQALVHHLEMVAWSLPSFSASHLFVFPFSASITFMRLRFFPAIDCANCYRCFFFAKVVIFCQVAFVTPENYWNNQKIICNVRNILFFKIRGDSCLSFGSQVLLSGEVFFSPRERLFAFLGMILRNKPAYSAGLLALSPADSCH